MSEIVNPRILDLTTSPWCYLLKVINEPNIKLNTLVLSSNFKILLSEFKQNKFKHTRFLWIPSTEYLRFACYLDGLITANSEYKYCTLDILVGKELEVYFPERFEEELNKGLRKEKFGNKYIDVMLKLLR